MIKVEINGVDFTSRVEIDLSFVEKLNRELDEGYISIPHSFRARPFSMFDVVDIFWDDTLIFSGRISLDRVTVASFNDRLFNHEISLVEHTKILEKYIIKGKTFTKPLEESQVPAYTILEVLQILRNTNPLELESLKTSYRPFNIPQETIDLTSGVIAPEFNFKDLTLRQALDQVASVLDSIVRLDRNSDLTFTQYDKLKDKINFVANNYLISQNINDYSTTVESEMLNSVMGANDVVNDDLEEVYPSKTGYTTLRSTGYLFGFEDDAHIPTSRPIYRVNNVVTPVEIIVNKQEPQQSQETVLDDILEIPIGDRVLPFETWNTLDIDEGVFGQDTLPVEFKPDNFFKNNTAYFRYGKKNIFVGEVFGVFGINNVLLPLVYASTFAHLRNIGVLPQGMNTSPYIDENGVEWELFRALPPSSISSIENRGKFLARVFYTPIPRALRFQIERDTINEINFYSETVVNQQTRLIDIEKYGNNLKGRVNQMGNSVKQLSHRIDSPLESFNIGDFILDDGLYVITQKEVIVHRQHTIVNYELTRNFNNFSQFMGVNKQIRQSEVGESDRTIERDLLYKEFIEIETTKNTQAIGLDNSLTILDKEPIIRTIDPNTTHEGIDFSVFTNEEFNDWFVVSLNKVSGGNTIGFNFELESNISAGDQLRIDSRIILPDRSFNEPVPYADSQARFENLKLRLYKESLYDTPITDSGSFNAAVDFADKLPFVDDADLPVESPLIEGEWYVAKDNREVIKFSLLYPILSKNIENLVIGNRFALLNGITKDGQTNVQLWVYESRRFDTSDANKSLEAPDIVYDQNIDLLFNISDNKIIIQNEIPANHSWALVDDEGYPYLMSNNDNHVIILNFENKRRGIQYLGLKPVFLEFLVEAVGESTIEFIAAEAIDLLSNTTSNSTIEFTAIDGILIEAESVGSSEITLNVEFISLESVSSGVTELTVPIEFISLETNAVSTSEISYQSFQPLILNSISESETELTFNAEVKFSSSGNFGTITSGGGNSNTLTAAPGGVIKVNIGNIFGVGTLRASINGGAFVTVSDGSTLTIQNNQTLQFNVLTSTSWNAIVAVTDNITNNTVGTLGINIP